MERAVDILVKTGGIGAAALSVMLSVYRAVLRLKVFSRLTRNQTARILTVTLWLTGSITVAGLVVSVLPPRPQTPQVPPPLGDPLRISLSENARALHDVASELRNLRGSIVLTEPGIDEGVRRIASIERRLKVLEAGKGRGSRELDASLGKAAQDLSTAKEDYANAQRFHLTNDPNLLVKLAHDFDIAIINTPEKKKRIGRVTERSSREMSVRF